MTRALSLVEAVEAALAAIAAYPERQHPLTASELVLRDALRAERLRREKVRALLEGAIAASVTLNSLRGADIWGSCDTEALAMLDKAITEYRAIDEQQEAA